MTQILSNYFDDLCIFFSRFAYIEWIFFFRECLNLDSCKLLIGILFRIIGPIAFNVSIGAHFFRFRLLFNSRYGICARISFRFFHNNVLVRTQLHDLIQQIHSFIQWLFSVFVWERIFFLKVNCILQSNQYWVPAANNLFKFWIDWLIVMDKWAK